jgi:chromosome segregation ATPase
MSRLDKFDGTLNELEQELVKLRSSSSAFQKVQDLSGHLTNSIEKLNAVVAQQNELQQDIDERFQAINKQSEENFSKLQRENKTFYNDLENTLRIKLEEHRSEIQRSIEASEKTTKTVIEDSLAKMNKDLGDKTRKVFVSVLVFSIIQVILLIVVLLAATGVI